MNRYWLTSIIYKYPSEDHAQYADVCRRRVCGVCVVSLIKGFSDLKNCAQRANEIKLHANFGPQIIARDLFCEPGQLQLPLSFAVPSLEPVCSATCAMKRACLRAAVFCHSDRVLSDFIKRNFNNIYVGKPVQHLFSRFVY